MKTNQLIIMILLLIGSLIFLTYTVINQQQQIVKLEQQLQQEQLKYKMLYRDPMVRDVIKSGG